MTVKGAIAMTAIAAMAEGQPSSVRTPSAIFAPEAAVAYRLVGLHDLAAVLEEAMAFFGPRCRGRSRRQRSCLADERGVRPTPGRE
jgi:hypothetical protein